MRLRPAPDDKTSTQLPVSSSLRGTLQRQSPDFFCLANLEPRSARIKQHNMWTNEPLGRQLFTASLPDPRRKWERAIRGNQRIGANLVCHKWSRVAESWPQDDCNPAISPADVWEVGFNVP